MKKRLLLILFYVFFSIHSSLSQQHYSRNYTINEGLPDNCIRDIYKDSRGFLWLATDAGLTKFDGIEFSVYTSQDKLIGDNIWSVTEDDIGNIWIGCHDGGISKHTGREIISFNTENGLISNEVRKVYYSKKFKLLFIGTEDGLSILKEGKFISFHQKLNNVNQRLQITDFLENEDYIYVFTNGNGLYKFIPNTASLLRVPADNPLNSIRTNSAYISSTQDTIINFDRKKILTIKNGNRNSKDLIGQIVDYREDHNKNIWIAAWNNNYVNAGGLFKYDNTGIQNFGEYIGIKTKDILSLEFDSKENLLWIGTKEQGLYMYPLTNYTYYKAIDFKLPELNISDLHVDNLKNLWIVAEKNIIKKIDTEQYKTLHFELFKKIFEQFVRKKIKLKYSYLNDKNGSYEKYQQLISNGTYPYSNPYYNLNGGKIEANSLYKPLKYDVIINKQLREFNSVITDKKGNIWIGSNVGIFKIDHKSEKIKYYDIEGNQFSKFHIDTEGKLYGISWTDLYIFPDLENSSEHYLYNHHEHDSPINITKIIDYNGKVCFSSTDHGLYLYDSSFFSTYKHKSIESQSFNDICFDNLGNLITANNNGKIYVFKLLEDSLNIQFVIDNKNGLLGSSVRFLSCTQENMLIAGTNAGLNIIDLKELYNTGNIDIKTFDKSNGFTDYSGEVSVIQNEEFIWIGSSTNLV
ncbi:two-component regulator propeller domain-containing protein, partial [Bacteroidota bacterium]